MASGPPIKHTWIFFDSVGARWDEEYWCNASSARTSLGPLEPAVINKRLAFLHPTCKLRMIQAAEYQGNRTTWERIYNLGGLPMADPTVGPDLTASAIYWRLVGTNGGRRFVAFRGLPDNAIARNPVSGFAVVGDLVRPLIEAWVVQAAALGYGINFRKRKSVADNTDTRLVINVDGTDAAGSLLVTLDSVAGYNNGDRVRLAGFDPKQFNGLDGEYYITNVSDTTFNIAYTPPSMTNFGNVGATARRIVQEAISVINPNTKYSNFSHFNQHQTKSDFTRTRGARRAKRIRPLV